MQIRKFEAPTIQEAIETIKRELGPEAIILQTKKNKRGFGLLSKGSVEVTAAVSDRSLQKKGITERKLSDTDKQRLQKMPAEKQVDEYDKNLERWLEARAAKTRENVSLSGKGAQGQGPGGKASAQPQQPSLRQRMQEDDGPPRSSAAAAVRSNVSSRESGAIAAQIAKATRQAAPAGPSASEEEVRQLKRMVQELKAEQEQAKAGTDSAGPDAKNVLHTPALKEAYELMTLAGVDRRIAYGVMRKVSFELPPASASDPDAVLDQTASEIMEQTEVMSLLEGIEPRKAGSESSRKGPAVVALVGPTGVGKTTTLAKIASEAVLKRNLRVGLINVDTYKVAATDQLSAYAGILKTPFRSVADEAGFELALKDFQALDLILVDTTGRSQKDEESLRSMERMLHSVPGVRTQLVLSATTRDQEAVDMGRRFSALFRPEGLILSKLDEALSFGAVLNVSDKLKLPLMYFTTGQRVPEDIEGATKERVASLVMEL